ncbi:uncharacterized protein MELLADRAFT_101250 [Melampsora larici-populina 98AG31]|uniref:Uncharacterized protein n=1 Tax=Melampsora larici-populina (strain 98AG31 / pathotype 3-4-7) TaxID=747676 RepID=F4R445_MELLP|nr:uncharacterized protein MELLADRAFT_101250 [Melampsora larici-populina 98AG31]EGG13055.1 hypothetical protein MELLADRAFT_101250 [Melampsora larici-populina 98AG31]
MTTEDTLTKPLNETHSPDERGLRIFEHVSSKIKRELIRLRRHWDNHEVALGSLCRLHSRPIPRMFARSQGISDHDLTDFSIKHDLTSIRSGQTSYGTVVFGKIRIPAVKDEDGFGFIHVRLHDPPGNEMSDVILHAILTEEVKENGSIVDYRAIMRQEDPLTWFDE